MAVASKRAEAELAARIGRLEAWLPMADAALDRIAGEVKQQQQQQQQQQRQQLSGAQPLRQVQWADDNAVQAAQLSEAAQHAMDDDNGTADWHRTPPTSLRSHDGGAGATGCFRTNPRGRGGGAGGRGSVSCESRSVSCLGVLARFATADPCERCGAPFGFFRSRHRCRCCAALVCAACSPQRAVLAAGSAAQRVCSTCFGVVAAGDPTGAAHAEPVASADPADPAAAATADGDTTTYTSFTEAGDTFYTSFRRGTV